jgi:hypothetical protein
MILAASAPRPGRFRLAYKFHSQARRKTAAKRARAQAHPGERPIAMRIKGFPQRFVVRRA